MDNKPNTSSRLDAIEKNIESLYNDCKKLLPTIKWHQEELLAHRKIFVEQSAQFSILINFICQNKKSRDSLFTYCESIAKHGSETSEQLRSAAQHLYDGLLRGKAQNKKKETRKHFQEYPNVIQFPKEMPQEENDQ